MNARALSKLSRALHAAAAAIDEIIADEQPAPRRNVRKPPPVVAGPVDPDVSAEVERRLANAGYRRTGT